MYVDGEHVDTVPDGKYELTSESYCTNEDNEKDESITLNYDSETKGLSISPMTKKGIKCYLYFEETTTKNVETILGTIKVKLDTPDFSKTAQASCSSTSRCEETNGIYEGTDDYGTTYYWKGTVDNNWLQFGTNSSGQALYWRIIRINGDGTIRLIYNGTSTTQTGNSTVISTSQAFNSSNNNNAYVGYMYTSGQVHGLGNNSNVKAQVDTWFSGNLSDEIDYIDRNAGFCGDRYPSTSNSSSNGSGGTSTTTTYYAAYIRLIINKAPTLKCSDSSDLYTPSGSSTGNAVLQYPIGLISADEVSMAGGVYGTGNRSYYLYSSTTYWTMSPSWFTGSYGFVIYVDSNGGLNGVSANAARGVRPVINLRSDVQITGSGTVSDPFKVVGAS